MTDMVDLDNLPPESPSMREFLALSKTAALLERTSDTLAGGCVGAGIIVICDRGVAALFFMAALPLLTCMVVFTRWCCKRRMNRLLDTENSHGA